jgi:flagellar L-ring protein precursor FlgH
MRSALILVLAALPLATLGACSTITEAVKGPNLTPVGYPSALVPRDQAVLAQPEVHPQAASANSLWRVGARAFFNDQRASKVGDILTVDISIDDSAKTSNATSATHASDQSLGMPHLFGLESSLGKILPGGFDPASALATNSKSNHAGSGSVNRAEKISLTIAAVVTGVLPNGNLVIQGTQEVRMNTELRQLTVAGIVRPEDISSSNIIKHTQIAEARISYGGRGDIANLQKTPAGQALVQKFTPF